MNSVRQSKHALTIEDITEWLRNLRHHCHVKQSLYAVSAVFEAKCGDDYIYTGGVNVEHDDHNKLGMHGEHNALMILQTMTGGGTPFSRAWIMGAPESIVSGSTDPLADQFATPCGHCRQIALSFIHDDTEVFSVSYNGTVSPAFDLKKLLPNAFSERDLNMDITQSNKLFRRNIIDSYHRNFDGFTVFEIFSNLLKPHIINKGFSTSPITAVLLKLSNGRYIPGVLVQDIAFMTTDAVYAAMGHAIARFGAKQLQIEEIHLFSPKPCSEKTALLNGSELKHLRQFSEVTTPIFYYEAEKGLVSQTTLALVAKQIYENDFAT